MEVFLIKSLIACHILRKEKNSSLCIGMSQEPEPFPVEIPHEDNLIPLSSMADQESDGVDDPSSTQAKESPIGMQGTTVLMNQVIKVCLAIHQRTKD